MTHSTPLIGISVGSGPLRWTDTRMLWLRPTYVHAVSQAGGAPVMIPLETDRSTMRSVYDRLDAVIISGGGDIDPARYGSDSRSPYTSGVNPTRDEVEMQLVEWAIADDKPLLAICRGHQVLNVTLGGTLTQDIRESMPDALRHEAPNDSWFTKIVHEVEIDPQSKLYSALDLEKGQLDVNSLHHQAVDMAAPDLCVVAKAPDGIIEALELPDKRFVVGVQWHPEALVDDHPEMHHLFKHFIDIAST